MGRVKKVSQAIKVPGVQNTQLKKKKEKKEKDNKINKVLLSGKNKSDLKKPNVSRKIVKNVLANAQYSKTEKHHDLRNKHAAENQSAKSNDPSNNKKTKVLEQVSTNANGKTKRKQQKQLSTETEIKAKRKKGNKNQDTNSNQINNNTTVAIKKDKKVQMSKELKETKDSRLGKTQKKNKNLKKPTEHKTNLNLSNTKKKRLNKKKMKQVIKQIRASPEVEEKNSAKIVTLNEHEMNFNQLKEMLAKPRKKQRTSSLPLRERMMAQLRSSRFRFINETLYKNHSSESKQYFKKDSEDFQAYHEGYKQQVKQWPVNPLDVIISSIKNMPKSNIIADFGCGEAILAASVPHKVHSFDFVALNDRVQACDMAHTPLLASSVHVVVFCLSLMGTNLNDYILEANRVLKKNGVLKIAEVESRFYKVRDFIRALDKYGFKNTWKDLSHNLFYFMDFTKERDITMRRQNLPEINLKSCLYKKR
ncbi:ribosomal RNA-processing protein 8 [Pseudomyrmex gracilis]|uniref:ribosomal RNA-processing protein 8 n=1 Tax=Pseudomyrmex gracilis TaxID=219809 RepID=UPI000994C2F2|nr:ribosomal RNA-processing protein 8 [Pseudomyrmex gracilis]